MAVLAASDKWDNTTCEAYATGSYNSIQDTYIDPQIVNYKNGTPSATALAGIQIKYLNST